MEIILQLFMLLALITVANLVTKSAENRYRRLFDRFIIIVSLPLLFSGIFFVAIPDEQLADMMLGPNGPAFPFTTNSLAFGVLLQLMAFWGIVFSLYSTRKSLARYIPVNPDSSVHTLATVCVGWLAGATLIQVSQNDLAQIVEAIGTISIASVVVEESLFVLIALLGVGLLIRRTVPEALSRLGLTAVSGHQLLQGVLWVFLLVMVQFIAGGLWLIIDPEQAEQVNSLNIELQSSLDTFWEWSALAIAAGVGEEVLFRGALQPVFGLWATSFLFALVHVQYGFFTPATLALFIIGFSLGLIRRRHNTTLAVLVHVGYDFVLGMISLLAVGSL